MIHDAQDGTSGRAVWEIRLPSFMPGHMLVIAASADAATDWFRRYCAGLGENPDLTALTVTDRGSADRTEIGLWRDETRLPNGDTDTQPERGA